MMSMTTIPTTRIASSFGMSACGHTSITGGALRVSGLVRRGAVILPTQGQVADFAGKRDYATTGSHAWRPLTS